MFGQRCFLRWRTLACASLLGIVATPLRAQVPPQSDDAAKAVEITVIPPEPFAFGPEPRVSEVETPAVESSPALEPEGKPLEPEREALDPDLPEMNAEPEADAPLDFPTAEDIPSPTPASLEPVLPSPSAEASTLPTLATDRETLRRFALTEPRALGPLSIGTPDGGLLFNPVPMPEGTLWAVRNPRDSFGTVETIGFIETAVLTVEQIYPGSPRLVISDISRADGGRLDRHKSHQAGRDADIGFYYRSGEAPSLQPARKGDLDLARTWTLLRAFITRTDVERVFLDRQVQRVLYDYALAEGEDRDWLDDLYGRQGKDALIQHERGHLDHMHVRFFNRDAQEHGRLAYPVLVEAGLLPGPMVKHRVTQGETLSHLARRYGTSAAVIRTANGLHGSALRAGRTYLIPVRKIPTPGEPVVVPPRRLPPEPATLETAATASASSGR